MDVVVQEPSLVGGAISPSKVAVAVLLALDVVTFVLSAIGPGLLAMSMLFILLPLTFVLRAVSVHVLAIAMSLVVAPLALINIAVSMNQAPGSVGLVVLPEPFVEGTICPDLSALAVALIGCGIPLTLVLGTILKDLFLLENACNTIRWSIFMKNEGSELIPDLLNLRIVIVIFTILVI